MTFESFEAGDKARFVITHTEPPNRDELVDISGGWHAHIDTLEALLRGTKPKSFWVNIAELEKYYGALYLLDAAG